MQAATHFTGPMTAADIMSRDLVTVDADTPALRIADLFRKHQFTCIPVLGPEDDYLGIIFQIHLILEGPDDLAQPDRRFGGAIAGVLRKRRNGPVRAGQLMEVSGPRASPATSVTSLLGLMANGDTDAVPVLEDGKIVGIVTRTDMIAALARQSLHAPAG